MNSDRQSDIDRQEKMLEVLAQFRVVFRSIRRHYGEVKDRSGISGAQLWALAHVAENPGIKVGALAHAMAIHPSTASNLIRDIEAQGLVARQRLGKDQRSVQLNATPKGLRTLKRAPKPLIGVLQHALSELPPTSLDMLHLQLVKLVASLPAGDAKARNTPLSEI